MTVPRPSPPDYDGAHLRHVLPSACAALGLEGFENRLGVPECSIAVVVLADGLGDRNIADHTGHARAIAAAWRSAHTGKVLDCGAPATTANSLASFGTGLTPGEHGMIGYDLYAPDLGRVVNMLGGWDEDVNPLAWQPEPTVLGLAEQAGAEVLTVSREQFRNSGLTRAALRGGELIGARRIEGRFQAAADWIDAKRRHSRGVRQGPPPRLLVYLYVDELDKIGHHQGVDSQAWRAMLEALDAALGQFSSRLHNRYGDAAAVLLTADHGMVDIAEEHRIDVSDRQDLLAGVAVTAGDPRMVYLHCAPGQDAEELAARWRQAYGDIAWVLTRQQAVDAGWFGEITERSLPRIGDVIVALHADAAIFHSERTGADPLKLVGLHGSITETERKIPLLELTGRGFLHGR